ncbi:MAG: SwmB domain-containing protein, partial [Chloroflexi bacterium]|nr:SwmB domain-containing protein [Chloroflexota bacterium]
MALLALAAALALNFNGSTEVAEAGKFDPVLATNMAQAKVDANMNPWLSQHFVTGSNSGGYTLNQVQVDSNDPEGDDFTMEVCVANADRTPSDTCWPLTSPESFARGRLTFTAPGGLGLAPDTTYAVVMKRVGSEVVVLSVTDNTAEDGRIQAGWSIGDRMRWYTGGNWVGFPRSRVVRLSIRGTPNASASLISTLGLTDGGDLGTITDLAQEFVTGLNPGGYRLSSVEIRMATNPSRDTQAVPVPTVTVHKDTPTGPTVATLKGPAALDVTLGSLIRSVPEFTAPTGVILAPSTSYFVRIRESSNFVHTTVTRQSPTLNTSQTGWAFGPTTDLTNPDNASVGGNRIIKLRVNGVGAPPPSPLEDTSGFLVSNLEQPIEANSQYNMGTGGDYAKRFRTGGSPSGYTLTGVTLTLRSRAATTLVPTVTLHSGSGAGTQEASFSGPSNLQAGTSDYQFTLSSPATLSAFTDYWIKVEGSANAVGWPIVQTSARHAHDVGGAPAWSIDTGSEFRNHASTGAFTTSTNQVPIGISGTVLPVTNAAAAGTPSITVGNVYRVPATLRANISAITDGNGVHGIEHTVTYRWQRMAAIGSNVEQENIGTGPTYTLTSADVGKRIRLQVRFTDDAGHSEGPLNSSPTTAVTAAATCAAPVLAGDFELIGGAREVMVAAVRTTHGFDADAGLGDMSDPQFTSGGNTYEMVKATSDSDAFTLTFDRAIAQADKPKLAVHVCDDGPYSLSGATTFLEVTTDLPDTWTGHVVRDIYVSQDAKAPEIRDASVNGTSLVITFHETLGEAANLANSAFTVKKGSGGTTQTLTGTPTIAGSTVTLTLDTPVTGADTDVKVAYERPASGTDNKLVDRYGNPTPDVGDTNVRNELAESVPPMLDSTTMPTLAADGRTLTITFNEPMNESSTPAASAFTVRATPQGGSEQTDLATNATVDVDGSTVVLTLARRIAHNDTGMKVAYEKPALNPLEDANRNALASFGDQDVTNGSTVPRVSVSVSHADLTPVLASVVFTFTRSNTDATNDLTLAFSLSQTDTYAESFTGDVDDEVVIPAGETTKTVNFRGASYSGNTSGTFTVTLDGGDDHLPHPTRNSATVDVKVPASGLYVTASHRQASQTVEEGGSVTHVVDFVAHAGVAMPRNVVTLALLTVGDTAILNEDFVHVSLNLNVHPEEWRRRGQDWVASKTVTLVAKEDVEIEEAERFFADIRRPQGTTNAFNHAPGGERATFTITDNDVLKATGAAVTSTPANGYYGVGDNILVTVTFNEVVTVDATSGTPYFAIDVAGNTRQARYSSGSDSTELVFTYTVASGDGDDHDGVSWGANPLELNGGTITQMGDATVAALRTLPAQAPQPGHRVDTVAPALEVAQFDDDEVYLIYSEDLNTTAPANSAFSVRVAGGSAVNPTMVSIAGNVVTLTLASAAGRDETVTVTYTKPGSAANPIKDLTGKEADGFTNENAELPASDIENLTASPGDTRVTLTWDRLVGSELTRYQYRYRSTDDVDWSPNWTNIPGSNASTTSFEAPNLTNGLEYTVEIRPVCPRRG